MYLKYISKLKKFCNEKKYKLTKIWNQKNYSIFKIVINKNPEKTICITAGIHGDERSAPFGILKFLFKYKPKNNDPKIIIFPLLNPYGFEKNKYENHKNIDLNHHFLDKPLKSEIKLIYGSLKHEKISIFVAFHEDDEKKGLYLYNYSDNVNLFKNLIKFLSKKCKIYNDKKIYRNKSKKGIITNPKNDGSFEERMYKDGVHYSTCIEIPDYFSFSKRVNLVVDITKYLVNILKLNK